MSLLNTLNEVASPWATMLDASFRGVKFQVAGISDKGEKSLAVHEYPYRPGAEVEDLGRKARLTPVRAIFWGRNYLSEVSALVRAFEESGKGELVHPLFGTLQVCVKHWNIEHDAETRDYAAVDFEFIEASLDNPFFDAKSMRGLADKAQGSMLSGLTSAMNEASAALAETLAPLQEAAAYVQGAVLTELRAILDVYDGAGAVVRTAVSYIDSPVGFVTDLLACQFSAASAVSGLGTFAGLSSLSGVFPRVSLSSDKPQTTYAVGSSAYGDSWITGPQNSASSEQLSVRQAGPAAVPAATDAPSSRQTARAQ
ncbi:DNA circularization N-terminal domain-containing protein, partial [Desulfovibrio sp. 1214_IL3152]|uniref:DNA circularization N-terminal domain-containing protein n=1 Tax=Desulfovibrio sp. 1214_IL3152 TaxID=3084056 RepID=UPI002FD96611